MKSQKTQSVDDTNRDLVAHERQKRKAMGLLLSSGEGVKLMAELEKEFDADDIMGATPEMTAFNVGARHVYRVLKALRDEAQKE